LFSSYVNDAAKNANKDALHYIQQFKRVPKNGLVILCGRGYTRTNAANIGVCKEPPFPININVMEYNNRLATKVLSNSNDSALTSIGSTSQGASVLQKVHTTRKRDYDFDRRMGKRPPL
jgi:hypothetical protein